MLLLFFDTHEKCESVKRHCTVWQKFYIVIFLDTINVIKVPLCMMVLLVGLYLSIPLSVTVTVYVKVTEVSVLTENVMFLSSEVETL